VSTFENEFFSAAARLVAGALLAGLWQGILLCAIAGLAMRLVPKTTARMRFVVWIAVFCVSVAMPFVNLHGAMLTGRAVQVSGRHLTLDLRWSYLLAIAWMAAVVCRSFALVRQGIGLRTLWKSAIPVANELLSSLDGPLIVAGRKVEVCTSNEVDRPSVIGFFAPRILVPAWLFDKLTAVELKHIVLHEMEHLRRRDDWMNLVQKIGLVILPLNPALFWIDRRLSAERELACDDGVLERTKAPRAYAASLTSIAERRLDLRASKKLAALALGATGMLRRRSEFSRRIESILGRRASVNPAMASGLAAVLVAAIMGSAAGLAHAPQLVSFGPSAGAEIQQASASAAPFANTPHMRASQTLSSEREESAVRYENASFHVPAKTGVPVARSVVARTAKNRLMPQIHGRSLAASTASMRNVERPFVVLTSSKYSEDDAPVSQVLLATPDGRIFLVPIYLHAAVPTQDGWLIVQL
jgi:beta-lactamase regulating signal transducer with metallopeptidase domain